MILSFVLVRLLPYSILNLMIKSHAMKSSSLMRIDNNEAISQCQTSCSLVNVGHVHLLISDVLFIDQWQTSCSLGNVRRFVHCSLLKVRCLVFCFVHCSLASVKRLAHG